jgi:iron(III) transport system ATP-binding protein
MLTVTDLAKSFVTAEGPVKAVDGASFSVAPAQCYALLGPSGCGKTTILRCVAGLEQAEQGSIAIGGRMVSGKDVFVPVHQRSIGMVFQSYAIWPHLDVFDNVAYPLEVERPRVARAEIEKRVMDVLALVGMQTMARRPATRLSGGQQQRVALARAIVRRPSLLLLDEPLSNLDARLRDSMRRELATLIRQIGVTALFVTHDQVEALSLADRVAVMDQGRIVQEGARPRSMTGPQTCSSRASWARPTCSQARSRRATVRGMRKLLSTVWAIASGSPPSSRRAQASTWFCARKISPSPRSGPRTTSTRSRAGSRLWRSKAARSNTKSISAAA